MASVVVNGDTSGAVTLTAPAVAGTVTVTLPSTSGVMAVLPTATGVLAESAGGTGTTTGYYGFKNRIINGAMVIDQRYAGGTIGPISGAAFTVDRWKIIRVGGTSTLTPQQSTTAPTGFTNSLIVTVGSGATPATTEERSWCQPIEGFNVADLGWGAAGAQTITISFWVQSSVTGTFGVVLGNAAFNRSYVASYAISSANTWEYKTITVAGDTSGTWAKNNTSGVVVFWDLGTGPTYSGSATGAWQAAGYEGLTGGTKLSATTGATFYITGVQLEKGATATSFDYRPYGTELALCQRYYYKIPSTGNTALVNMSPWTTTSVYGVTTFHTVMRTMTPSMSYSSLSDFTYYSNGSSFTPTGIQMDRYSQDTAELLFSFGSSVGSAGGWVRMSGATGWIAFSGEL